MSASDLSKSKVVRTGYTARDDVDQSDRQYSLEELVGPDSDFKFKLVHWKAE